MDINWSRYIGIARAQDLGNAEVARLIRTETRRKVNISEVKWRLSVSENSAAQIRQPNSLEKKYDGRGQIIIERGQFFHTNLHGAFHDRPQFKTMMRGHLTS